MNTPTMSSGGDSSEARRTFAAAARFAGVVVVVALIVLGLALLWVDGCRSGGADALVHCGTLRRGFLAAAPPLVLFLGGAWAFVQTIKVWRAEGRWWIWQGAGWFLLALMLVVLFMTAPQAIA
jgi:hypothetical protein